MGKQRVVSSILILVYVLCVFFGVLGVIGYPGVVATNKNNGKFDDMPAEVKLVIVTDEDIGDFDTLPAGKSVSATDEDDGEFADEVFGAGMSPSQLIFGRSDPNNPKNIDRENYHILYTVIYDDPDTLEDDTALPYISDFIRFHSNGPIVGDSRQVFVNLSGPVVWPKQVIDSQGKLIFKKRFSREALDQDLCRFIGCWHKTTKDTPLIMLHPGRDEVGYPYINFNNYESHDISVLSAIVGISTWSADEENIPSDRVSAPAGVTNDNVLWYFMSPMSADSPTRELTANQIYDIVSNLTAPVLVSDRTGASPQNANSDDGYWVFEQQGFRFGDDDAEVAVQGPLVALKSVRFFGRMGYDGNFNFLPSWQSVATYQPQGVGGYFGLRAEFAVRNFDKMNFVAGFSGFFTSGVTAHTGVGNSAAQGKSIATYGYYNSLLSTNKGASGGVISTFGVNASVGFYDDAIKLDFFGSVTGGLGSRRHTKNWKNVFGNDEVKYSVYQQSFYKAKDLFAAEMLSGDEGITYLFATPPEVLVIYRDHIQDTELKEFPIELPQNDIRNYIFKPSTIPEQTPTEKAVFFSQYGKFVVECPDYQDILPETTWLKALKYKEFMIPYISPYRFGEHTKISDTDYLVHTLVYCVDIKEEIGKRVAGASTPDVYLQVQGHAKLMIDLGAISESLTGLNLGFPISGYYQLIFFQSLNEFSSNVAKRIPVFTSKDDVIATLKSVLSFRGVGTIKLHKFFVTSSIVLTKDLKIQDIPITITGSFNASFSATLQQTVRVKARAFVADNDDVVPAYFVTFPKYYRVRFGGFIDFSGIILSGSLRIGSKVFFGAGSTEIIAVELRTSYLQ